MSKRKKHKRAKQIRSVKPAQSSDSFTIPVSEETSEKYRAGYEQGKLEKELADFSNDGSVEKLIVVEYNPDDQDQPESQYTRLSKELADLRNQYNSNTNFIQKQGLLQKVNALNGKLKELEQEQEMLQRAARPESRNVGNYESQLNNL